MSAPSEPTLLGAGDGCLAVVPGEVLFAQAHVLSLPDPKAGHPVVVLQDQPLAGLVQVIGRTSTVDRFKGLAHPPVPELGLDRPGVFALRFFQSIRHEDFTAANVEQRGHLDPAFFGKLLAFVGMAP